MPKHTTKAKGGMRYKAKGGMKYKAKKGLGMVSVETGFDNNPNVTRADVIQAAKKKKGEAKRGMKMKAKKAENGIKPIVKKKKNPITGGTKTKTITRNPDGTTTRSKVKYNRFGEVVKQKSKTTGAGDTKTKKKYTKASGKTVSQTKGRATVGTIAKGAGDTAKTMASAYAALPGIAGGTIAYLAGADKLGDKILEGTGEAAERNLKGATSIGRFRKNVKKTKTTEEGNTFMMGGRVNYPGKVSPDSNYDMLNKQQS